MENNVEYFKHAFDVITFNDAKNVVLTADPSNPTKFDDETTFFINVLNNLQILSEQSNVLDFGCGMGRVAKELIKQFNCNVIGVDISESMRTFAMLYVASPKKFKPTETYDEKNTIDCCIATFVLQHVECPEKEIETIYDCLKQNGYLIVVNENIRYVPIGVDMNNYVIWKDDHINVLELLDKTFELVTTIPYMNTDVNVKVYQKR